MFKLNEGVPPIAPSSDLVDRFRARLETLSGGLPGRLGVAVSGGPDSLALLLLASTALPGRVEAATVDHRLRSQSNAEARHVAAICAEIGCPHSTIEVSVTPGARGLQAEARAARYAALIGWAEARGIGHLATAHHLDDQAETFLMRAQRGAGLAGLAGVRATRRESQVLIVRPLLGWRKAELIAVVADAGLDAVDDPSNRDPRYDRTAARHLLETLPVLDPTRLAHSAAALAQAEEALQWAVDRAWRERVSALDGKLELDHEGLPAEIKRRLLIAMLGTVSPGRSPRGGDIDRLLGRLAGGGIGTLGEARCSGGAVWTVEKAAPRRKQI